MSGLWQLSQQSRLTKEDTEFGMPSNAIAGGDEISETDDAELTEEAEKKDPSTAGIPKKFQFGTRVKTFTVFLCPKPR